MLILHLFYAVLFKCIVWECVHVWLCACVLHVWVCACESVYMDECVHVCVCPCDSVCAFINKIVNLV